jgi:hypothetical protein
MSDISHSLPPLTRTLSHQFYASKLASPYFDGLQEGGTIFSNYFIDKYNNMIDVDYYERVDGVILQRHIREPFWVVIAYPWSIYSVPLPHPSEFPIIEFPTEMPHPIVLNPTSSCSVFPSMGQ